MYIKNVYNTLLYLHDGYQLSLDIEALHTWNGCIVGDPPQVYCDHGAPNYFLCDLHDN